MVSATPEMMEYFLEIKEKVSKAHKLASKSRVINIDPEPKVEISIAENMAERVVGLISVIAPQIANSGVVERIQELEKQYGVLDWRVALKIAEEVALEKFCKFKDKNEAMSVGIRIGFAYSTVGVVASPLDGIIDIQVKKRLDNRGDYICLIFAGPIRNAGGTNAALSVIISDYVRIKMGYDAYDASEDEIKRSISEIRDYDERVSPRQHKPSDDEVRILIGNIPVEVGGDPSEKIEVSNFKNLPRIPTNIIRSGFCLICTDCIPLKAPKLWKQLSVWGKDFGLEHWDFLAKLIDAQKKAKSKGDDKKDSKSIAPNYSFIADLVAGRPIIGYPLRAGGFRLRYGRSRASGYSAQTISPATMIVLDKYLATGTQIKVERPGKAATLTTSEFIEGPIVKLNNGDVVYLDSIKKAKLVVSDVVEILFLGDLLIAYGDFLNRAHVLVPAGYCEEWWVQELEKSSVNLFGTIDAEKISGSSGVSQEVISEILKSPLAVIPSGFDAVNLSLNLKIPLHPRYTLHFGVVGKEEFVSLLDWFKKANVIMMEGVVEKIVLPNSEQKRVLELIGCPHKNVNNEFVVIEKDFADVLSSLFYLDQGLDGLISKVASSEGSKVVDLINDFGGVKIRDKSGIFIGSRMGRPEKAKQRKMTGSPHVLFPVGDQGGKFRSFQSAMDFGFVEGNFSVFYCEHCGKDVVYPSCDVCLKPARRLYFCKVCGKMFDESCPKHGQNVLFSKMKFDIKDHFVNCLKHLGMKSYPDLIKGVRGTSNKERFPEHLCKGVLRAKNDVFVFKDGTTRYDMTQLPMTHFKPKEIGTSIEKLLFLGYKKDIKDKALVDDDQVLELKPQDVILPGCDVSNDEGADAVLFRVSKFVDDALVSLYKQESFYNCSSPADLVGHLVICLAPHTSAGTVGRIIGFSKTQGFLAHPLMHAATRRDCVYPATKFLCYDKSSGELNYDQIGSYVDSLIKSGSKTKVVDSVGTVEVENNRDIYAVGVDPENFKFKLKKIKHFIKGPKPDKWIKIRTASGREFVMTDNHKFIYLNDSNKLAVKKAFEVRKHDKLLVAEKLNLELVKKDKVNLIDLFIKNLPKNLLEKIKIVGGSVFFKEKIKFRRKEIIKILNVKNSYKKNLNHWYNFVPLSDFGVLLKNKVVSFDDLPKNISLKVNFTTQKFPVVLDLDEDLASLLGFYAAEGHCRENSTVNQVGFRINDVELQKKVSGLIKRIFKINPVLEENNTKITICHKLVYYLFKYVFKTGSNAYNKRIPQFMYGSSNDLVKAFISSYLDGDGSVVPERKCVVFYSVNKSLLDDLSLLLLRFGIFGRFSKTKERLPGRHVLDIDNCTGDITSGAVVYPDKCVKLCATSHAFIHIYKRLNKEPKKHVLYHLTFFGKDCNNFKKILSLSSRRKNNNLAKFSAGSTGKRMFVIDSKQYDVFSKGDVLVDYVVDVVSFNDDSNSYCLEVDWKSEEDKNILWGEQIINARCDGDEACVIMLMDGFLNFSKHFLPTSRGATMDASLVLTYLINPAEVDDMVFDVDVAWRYPLELYEASLQYKLPWEVGVETLKKRLGTPKQYEGMGFTHEIDDINNTVRCSAYKTLPTMEDKLKGQMFLAEKLRSVNAGDVAAMVIEKHFLKDTKGNLRKFSMQEFRCVNCNAKYRRPPLLGKCKECVNGKIIFTISEGSIVKYLEPSLSLAEKYNVSDYLKQTLDLLQQRIESVFGRDKEKQLGLGAWF